MKYLGLPLAITRLRRIHFQPLEDKVAAKLVPWLGKHVSMAGRATLVRAVLTSIAIYYITVLDVPAEVLKKIDSIRRAYLWAACDKVTGGKCKVNWELVCKPKVFGGLEILNLEKFASALRMRWLWQEWNEEPKPWFGLGNPCKANDRNLFAAATKVTVGNGKKALFWEAAWLEGAWPKGIAPLIFDISKKKKSTVRDVLENNLWVPNGNIQGGITTQHIVEFTRLWKMLQDIHLEDDMDDSIKWKLTNDGCYSSSSAYKMQFLGLINSLMPSLVWKSWAPPKCKIFAWLIIQNRVWTADRLQRRGWQNCGRCKLCNQVQESVPHLLFKCRFTTRVWNNIKVWLGLHDVDTTAWPAMDNVKDWWTKAICKTGESRKAMTSPAMLISWEIWNERNARVFKNHYATTAMIVQKIKEETMR
jgi:hypothetical protein